MSDAHPVDSATVVLLRDAGDAAEVLLVQRHAESRAFGGAHVFPGGIVDADDRAPALRDASPALSGDTAAKCLGEALDGPSALAFWVAAIRELFEETGILLARVGASPLAFTDAALRDRFHEHRAALLATRLTFAEIIAREGLTLATDALRYWSRWITPVTAPRRYDARFFVAHMPLGQVPLHDERETVATAWLTPRAALAESRDGRIVLAPPTLRTLEDVGRCGTTAAVFAAATGRRVTPILPKTVQVADAMTVLYPGDEDYDAAEPGAHLEARAAGRLNRFVMGERGWRSFRSD
ncbi:MAG TPA: NUDIX hydrolase [Candidatus Binatia bacterium]|jgi:8-oxo-dGTP pyrophosphatase MutT (NUDIX family)